MARCRWQLTSNKTPKHFSWLDWIYMHNVQAIASHIVIYGDDCCSQTSPQTADSSPMDTILSSSSSHTHLMTVNTQGKLLLFCCSNGRIYQYIDCIVSITKWAMKTCGRSMGLVILPWWLWIKGSASHTDMTNGSCNNVHSASGGSHSSWVACWSILVKRGLKMHVI